MQKLIENRGPILLRIATGAPRVSQMPVPFSRILMCKENMPKLVKNAKMQNPREGEHRDAVRCGEMRVRCGEVRSVGGMRSAR